ncbi:hypothetical protein [Novosphingobium sp. 17-62-19]|uniref:hypothetical protein n=1 Tax=Novosphingobium sp. 17-62-19 TaxID=1970406 RepID=UPI0025F12057|nr:hypothetical protein [Novosphingobium sp. 17-62-19]
MIRMSKQVLGIHPKMYRNFAALTLAFSGTVALIVNGQPQQVQAQRHELADLEQAEPNKFGANQLTDKRSGGGAGGRGSGFRDSIDEPTDGSGNGDVFKVDVTVPTARVIVDVD